MKRQKAIDIIKNLFPTDAPYPKTAGIGQRLLAQAKQEVVGWEIEPTEVLIRYAQLCIEEDYKQERGLRKKGEEVK